ncbi:hypothetical protein K0U07_05000 [bacterium]|nr:hypothetical protein [bacterium]
MAPLANSTFISAVRNELNDMFIDTVSFNQHPVWLRFSVHACTAASLPITYPMTWIYNMDKVSNKVYLAVLSIFSAAIWKACFTKALEYRGASRPSLVHMVVTIICTSSIIHNMVRNHFKAE